MSNLPTEERRREYWKANLRWLGILLGIWAFVSYGCGILMVDFLDRFKLPGTNLKLGFWFAQQGSIYGFVLLIAVYVRVMNRLDRELLEGTGAEEGPERQFSFQATDTWTLESGPIFSWAHLRPLHRHRDLVARRDHRGVLCRRWRSSDHRQRHGDGGRLDERGLLHLHGRADLRDGRDGAVYLMGWTGGYVLLALLLAPYLRRFGKFTVPDFIGDRYYSSDGARRGGVLRDFRFVHLRRRPDARLGVVFSRVPRSRCEHGGLIGMVDRPFLRGARRDEGHHLHAGGAVLRADLRLHGARRSSSPSC